MKNTAVLTTTIAPRLALWLNTESKRLKTTKRAIIESALFQYKDEQKKRDLVESFTRAAQDPEMLALAEEGFEDSLGQLNRLGL